MSADITWFDDNKNRHTTEVTVPSDIADVSGTGVFNINMTILLTSPTTSDDNSDIYQVTLGSDMTGVMIISIEDGEDGDSTGIPRIIRLYNFSGSTVKVNGVAFRKLDRLSCTADRITKNKLTPYTINNASSDEIYSDSDGVNAVIILFIA